MKYAEKTLEQIVHDRIEKAVMKGLEALVGQRFNKKSLEAKLSLIFGDVAKVALIGQDNTEATDFNFLTNFDNEVKGIYGYADIYFLKMRRKGHDGATFYVTEVAYEFE